MREDSDGAFYQKYRNHTRGEKQDYLIQVVMEVCADVRRNGNPADEVYRVQSIQQEAGRKIIEKVTKARLRLRNLRLAFDDIAQTQRNQKDHACTRHPFLKIRDIRQQRCPENGEEYEDNVANKDPECDFDTGTVTVIDAVLDQRKEYGPESKTQCDACQRPVQ